MDVCARSHVIYLVGSRECEAAPVSALEALLLLDMLSVDDESNSAGTRGWKEERMEELRFSRSRESRVAVEPLNGELPLIRYEGRADLGFGPKGGGEPEPISCLPERLLASPQVMLFCGG